VVVKQNKFFTEVNNRLGTKHRLSPIKRMGVTGKKNNNAIPNSHNIEPRSGKIECNKDL
jgi:hypothetical protein